MATLPITIIRGSDRTFSVLINYTCGGNDPQPFDLSGTTEIKAIFPNADGTTVVETLTSGRVTITSPFAGKIKIFIPDGDTSLLNVGENQSFEIELHAGAIINIVQFLGMLNVVDRLFP
jgi:hypothetical protein